MSKIKIIPLGGVRESGKNLYVVEINDSIFVLDCGLVYPDHELYGIDAVIPDFTYLIERKDRVAGIFLTHGHADAVGALSYLLEEIDAPVFGTELTNELAKITAKSQGLKVNSDQFYTVSENTEIEFEDAVISFFKTTHTIPDTLGVVISTDEGAIVYTGNFKFDTTVGEGYRTDFARLAEIGQKGVLALLSDSQEANSLHENVPNTEVQFEISETFLNASGRVIVAAVGSNIQRIQQILTAAHQSNRTVFFAGEELYEIVDLALCLDKIEIPSKSVIGNIKELDKYDDNQIVVVETGSAGEPLKTLQVMARGRHPQVNVKEGDLIYIATTPHDSMEKIVAQTKDYVYEAGGRVREIDEFIKTSGHATPDDLRLMITLMQPKFFIPVAGENRQLAAHSNLAQEVGIERKNIIIPEVGDVITYIKGRLKIADEVQAGDVLVDGSGVGDIGSVVLRDRRILGEDGVFIVVATVSRRLGKVLAGPQITSRGFVFMKESTDLIVACSDITLDVLEKHLELDNFDWNNLKNDLREKLGKYLFKETKRRPVILPIIMDASNYQVSKDKE